MVVLGHKLTHIRNGDVRMMIVAVLRSVVSFFRRAEIVRLWFYKTVLSFRSSRSDERRGGGAGFAVLIAIGLSRRRLCISSLSAWRCALAEFLADAGSVELTKNPDAMISALRKIEGRGELPGATSAVMEMCVDNPREGFGGELFDTHPSVERRITALVQFAGGHDPVPMAVPRRRHTIGRRQSSQKSPSQTGRRCNNIRRFRYDARSWTMVATCCGNRERTPSTRSQWGPHSS